MPIYFSKSMNFRISTPLSHSTLIEPSDVLSNGTGHITTRVHHQGSHSYTRREEDDLRRRVTTQRDTCDTRQINQLNVREVLLIANYCRSRYLLTHRELPNIREVSREHRYLSSVTYWVFTNLSDIWKVLWNGLTSEFGQLSGIKNLPNIRRVSRKCQHLSLGIFLELENLPNILEVLPLVRLSRVPPSVFILPIVLLNFVDRHATSCQVVRI